MPRYFFNVRREGHAPEATGVDLSDTNAARREAIRYLGEEMRHNSDDLGPDEELYVEVVDESGSILFTTYSAAHRWTAGATESVAWRLTVK